MTEIVLRHKVVINRCAGRFDLSPRALWDYAARRAMPLHAGPADACIPYEDEARTRPYRGHDIARDDPDLIAVVEDLGARASGEGCDLGVVLTVTVIRVIATEGGEYVTVGGRTSQFDSGGEGGIVR